MRVKEQKLRTLEEARAALEAHGITLTDLARVLDVPVQGVKNVLSRKPGDPKRTRGRFGASHKVMVALGMKAAPPGQQALDLSTLAVSHRQPSRRWNPKEKERHVAAA